MGIGMIWSNVMMTMIMIMMDVPVDVKLNQDMDVYPNHNPMTCASNALTIAVSA